MIELTHISKVFLDSKNKSITALKDINLTFSSQGFYSIVGKSGSGKSTLLNILSGLIKPTDGNYLIQGVNTNTFDDRDWANIRRTTLSYIFQEHNLIEHLTVMENLSIPLFNKNIEPTEIESRTIKVLSQFELENLKDQLCKNLSGGEKQRVAIVRGLLSDSRILIADEPTSALDETNTLLVYELLKEVSKTRLVIVVTHDMDMTNRYSDTIIKLNYGVIISNPENIPSSTSSIINHSSINLSFYKRLTLSKYFTRGQWFINTFMILFILIGMTLLTTTYSITEFNEDRLEYNIIKDKVDFNYISTSDIYFNTSEVTSDIDITELIPTLITFKTFNNIKGFHTGLINDNLSNARIFSTIMIQPLEDNHIIITDYQATLLKESGAISYSNINDLLDTTLSIYGIPLIIDDIIETDYLNQNMNATNIAVKYDVLRINNQTLNELVYVAYPKTIYQADSPVHALHPYTLERMSYGAYLGDNQLENSDIVIDFATLQHVLDIQLNSPEDASVYFDTDIPLVWMINDEIIQDTYRLKGIVFTDQPTVYFSEAKYHVYFNDTSNLEDTNSTLAFKLDNYETFLKVKSVLQNNQSFIFNEYSNAAYYAKSFIYSISQIFTILVIFSLIMVTLFIYFFTYMYFKQNRFNYGILLSMGYERKTSLSIAVIHIIKNIVIAFTMSTALAYLALYMFNRGYQSDLDIDINIISFSLTPYLATLLFSAVVSLIGILSVYHFIRKIDIIQLLK